MAENEFAADLVVRYRPTTKNWLVALATIALASSYAMSASPRIAVEVFVLGAVALLAAGRTVLSPNRNAHVRVDRDGLFIGSRYGARYEPTRIARDRIATGFYRPGAIGGDVVLLDLDGRELVQLRTANETQAVALLSALGLDASKTRFPIFVASPLGARLGRVGGGLTAFILMLAPVVASLYAGISPVYAIALAAVATMLGAWPTRAEIAADGVSLQGLFQRRFLPFARVRHVRDEKNGGAVLVLADGERVLVPRAVSNAGSVAMVARIREALDAHRSGGSSWHAAQLVARGDRDVATWLLHLRELRTEGYRSSALRDEDLWNVVEDPSATEDARAAAAVLLRPALDDDGRARIRVASGASASPRLRIALDAAADAEVEDEGVLEEQLAAVAREVAP